MNCGQVEGVEGVCLGTTLKEMYRDTEGDELICASVPKLRLLSGLHSNV